MIYLKFFLLILAVSLSSYVYGVLSRKHNLAPYPQLTKLKSWFITSNLGIYSNTIAKEKIDYETIKSSKTMVLLVLGQSNAANHGETAYTPKEAVYNFFDGNCYIASDPLLGGTGQGGSVWSRLGDKLINGGLADKVLFVPIGVVGTSIVRWKSDGDIHALLTKRIIQLKLKNIEIDYILWHQGESDVGMRRQTYKEMFLDMLQSIRNQGVQAPAFVAIASKCRSEMSQEIQAAQMELVDIGKKIFPGPNTDLLDNIRYRFDGCHFSNIGLEQLSNEWFESLVDYKNKMKASHK